MVDFSVFDALLDSTFVVDADGKVVYCNEAGANLLQSSVRRLTGKAALYDHIQFTVPGILPFTPDSEGRVSPSALIETAYTLPKAGRVGKTQLTVRPMDAAHWVFFLHDVSLEETLAEKYRGELAKTEEYARNLEKLVEARTGELRAVNKTLNAILESLGQGFFTFNAAGECGSVFTRACADILEGVPTNRKAWEVLGIEDKDLAQFRKWMETSFAEYLPFDDLKSLGPSLFAHNQQRHVTLDYFPIRREKGEISDIVVVATDKTTEHQAQVALEAERQYAAMVVRFLKNKDQFLAFLNSVRSSLQELRVRARTKLDAEAVADGYRALHTLEGEAGTFSLRDLRLLSREAQQQLEPYKTQISVSDEEHAHYVRALEVMSESFEKFITENENIFHFNGGEAERTIEVPALAVASFEAELKTAPVLRAKFRDLFYRVSFESRLKYFDSLLQTVAEKLGKRVKPLVIHGGEIAIYPEPYQAFFSSLVHAFRNAADHGLEDPAEREWAGKDPAGQVSVSIARVVNGFSFTVRDDGRGIDPAIIREKLKEKFPGRDFSAETDEQIIQHVALPGFSSRDSIGEFSGRGVGLDALREEVLSIGGSLHLRSTLGQGTSIEIFLPELGVEKAEVRRSA